jgi:hypothetical protein
MPATRSAGFFLVLGALGVLAALAVGDAAVRRSARAADLAATRALVRALDLTDPCLFTDARYTRHPAMADRHSPFQDHPLSLEHFPTGSLATPPTHLVAGGSTGGAEARRAGGGR